MPFDREIRYFWGDSASQSDRAAGLRAQEHPSVPFTWVYTVCIYKVYLSCQTYLFFFFFYLTNTTRTASNIHHTLIRLCVLHRRFSFFFLRFDFLFILSYLYFCVFFFFLFTGCLCRPHWPPWPVRHTVIPPMYLCGLSPLAALCFHIPPRTNIFYLTSQLSAAVPNVYDACMHTHTHTHLHTQDTHSTLRNNKTTLQSS